MPRLIDSLRAHMATTTRSFDDLDHTVLTHPLARYDGDTDALTRRVAELHAMGFPLLDLDDPVEVPFHITLAGFDLALDQLVVGRVDVLIQRRGDLLDLERREETEVSIGPALRRQRLRLPTA